MSMHKLFASFRQWVKRKTCTWKVASAVLINILFIIDTSKQLTTEKKNRCEASENYCYLLFWGKQLLIDKLN